MTRPDLGAMMAGAQSWPDANNDYGRFLRLLKEQRPDERMRLKSGKFLRLGNGHVEDRDGYPDDDWVYGTLSDADEAEIDGVLAMLTPTEAIDADR